MWWTRLSPPVRDSARCIRDLEEEPVQQSVVCDGFHHGLLAPQHVLSFQCSSFHNDSMPVQITIRRVPERVRDELAARAALRRQSMQEFLRQELERIASRPSLDTWLQRVRERKEAAGTRVRPSSILQARNADRT